MLNKPINATPSNSCVCVGEQYHLTYEIPNNTLIDGYYIGAKNLSAKNNRFNRYFEFDTPSSIVDIYSTPNTGGESTWTSFYWQTPNMDKAKQYTVVGFDSTKKELHLSAGGKYEAVCPDTYYKDHTGNGTEYHTSYPSPRYTIEIPTQYTKGIYESFGHTIGDDTSSLCYRGQLEDYFDYCCFYTGKAMYNKINSIGVGKCIIEAYDSSNKIAVRARILAMDKYNNDYICIVDNDNFLTDINALVECKITTDTSQIFYRYSTLRLYDISELNTQDDITGLMKYNDRYSLLTNCQFADHYYSVTFYQWIWDKDSDGNYSIATNVPTGSTIDVWGYDDANFNITPTYYYRCKNAPTVNITSQSLNIGETENTVKDFNCSFGVNYTSTDNTLNYFRLTLLAFDNDEFIWKTVDTSPILYNTEESYEFVGLKNGTKYKVSGSCVDNDGDWWDTDEVEFDVNVELMEMSPNSGDFNSESATIDVNLDDILEKYSSVSVKMYKQLKSDNNSRLMRYVGGGQPKLDNAVLFNKIKDYNVQNNQSYNYYLRASYIDNEGTTQGMDFYYIPSDIVVNFNGTYIMGLEKSNSSQLNIVNIFSILFKFDNSLSDITNEISREYMNTFGKYPKELKGNQNYISGNCSGLLGSEINHDYIEPKGIREAWKNFVNDDNIKLYRGLEGETIIISIDSSKITPHYFPNNGLVNEISFSFKQIASTDKFAIFETEAGG